MSYFLLQLAKVAPCTYCGGFGHSVVLCPSYVWICSQTNARSREAITAYTTALAKNWRELLPDVYGPRMGLAVTWEQKRMFSVHNPAKAAAEVLGIRDLIGPEAAHRSKQQADRLYDRANYLANLRRHQ
jgi:hypothetical protein